MTREEQIERIERDRRDREAAALLLLLALSDRARVNVNRAIRIGGDWRYILAATLFGDESLDLDGGVLLLALLMADSHLAGVKRVGRIVGVDTSPGVIGAPDGFDAAAETRARLVRRYEGMARDTLERIRQTIETAVAKGINEAASADRISADVRAAGGAFKATGFAAGSQYGAEREATQLITVSYATGMGEAYRRPEVVAVMTGLIYTTVKDDRRTDICKVREGVTLPLDDPYWFSGQYPPMHWGCRSIVLATTNPNVKFTENPPTFPPADPGWGQWAGMLSAFQA